MSENAGAKGPIEAGPMSRYTRLAPCPFCGSDVEADRDDMTGLVTVGCDRPGCCILDTSYGNEAEAIAAWNRRAGPSPEALEAENYKMRTALRLGGGHLRADGSVCDYLGGATCNKCGHVDDARLKLEAENKRLREALEQIEAQREQTVFSMSRALMDGNEAYMDGANTAFGQAADIASTALEKTP